MSRQGWIRRALIALGLLLGNASASALPPWASDAQAMLAGAAEQGLDPADYRVDPAAADPDIALQAAVLRYLRHLNQGRLTPKDLGFRVGSAAGSAPDIALRLATLTDGAQLRALAAELTPPLAQYRQLRETLLRYRELAAAPAFAALPKKPNKVEPGDAYEGAAALRQRLVAFGDLPADAAPATASYDDTLAQGVRRFQSRHGLDADGVIGRGTLAALNIPPAQRVRQIELALERLRWLPHRSGRPFVAINIPMFRLWAWDAGAPEAAPSVRMGVIVGQALRTQTPVFADELTHLIFRPYWNVPRSILRNEVLPAVERDPLYLRRHDMELVAGQGDDARPMEASPENLAAARAGSLRIRQRPGPKNSLGLVKFIFPNDDNVYLHDTPAQQLFSRSRRDFSHGCVRVEDPLTLATWLLRDQPEWTRERIEQAMGTAKTRQVNLSWPVPVILYYVTAAVTPDDALVHFADDLYGHDRTLERALAARRGR
jgi:murein L,D-transpeptidase YcbB/YkuD